MPDLSKHMAIVHQESDHSQMLRLTQTFESRLTKTSNINKNYEKIYDCSECGVIFKTSNLLENHNVKHHQVHQEEKKHKEEQEQQEWNEEEGFTENEIKELTKLHEEAMAPSQEEKDWMLLAMIKVERKTLANKYLPQLSNYKVEDTCDICHRYFYTKGNLQSHIERVHKDETFSHKIQVVPEEEWLSKSLPNLADLLATIPANTLVSKDDEIYLQKDYEQIMCELKEVKVEINTNQSPTINCDKCKFNATTSESLQIHNENVHETHVFKCEQCSLFVPCVQVLKIHKKIYHSTEQHSIVIKKIPEPHQR